MPKSILDILLESTQFQKRMSKQARQLQNDVIGLCCSNINPNQHMEFVKYVETNHNRVNWEKAIFWHNNSVILEGILKRTSKKFEDDAGGKKSNDPPWKRGTKASGASRNKNIDWFSLSTFEDSKFWHDMIQFPRELNIRPEDFDKMRQQFVPMYELITSWLLVDFSYSDLYRIFDISKNDSIEFVKQCMAKVDDRSKISVPYLIAIIEKERAIFRADLEDSKNLTEQTKQIFSIMLESQEKWEDIDWDDLDKKANLLENNMKEFDKVKLS